MSQPDDIWGHRLYSRFRPPVETFDAVHPGQDLHIAFLVGNTDISGGTYVILQHALDLMDRGHDVTLIPYFPHTRESASWHPAFERVRVLTFDEAIGRTFDVAVATWWRTAYELWRVRARHYAYFVQSIESRFYGSDQPLVRRLADGSFDLDLPTITIAKWIQWFLALEHGRPSTVVRNGIEKTVYHPTGPRFSERPKEGLRVLVEGPLDVPMKNVRRTIELARDAGVSDIWLLTSSDVGAVTGVDRLFSRVPITATAGIYRSCDVLLKLSFVEGMFGPPLEMFHCGGTTVCWDVTGHEEYVANEQNGLVVSLGSEEGVVKALRRLDNDKELLRRLCTGALETASMWPSWSQSSRAFTNAVEVIGRQPERDHDDLLRRSKSGHDQLA